MRPLTADDPRAVGEFRLRARLGAGGVAYFGSTDHNVHALRASDGAKLWSYDTGAAVYPRPVVASNAVYAGSDDNYVYALQA
jgi:eukaryotic-like serine/threonine-protein kinase